MQYLQQLKNNTRVVLISNPNNPTGSMVENSEIVEFMKKVPDDVLVLFDEAYAEICQRPMPLHCRMFAKEKMLLCYDHSLKPMDWQDCELAMVITTLELAKALNKPRHLLIAVESPKSQHWLL